MSNSKIIIEKQNERAEDRLAQISAELIRNNILFDVEDQSNIYVINLRGF
jgi:hypothetical protein